jgi:peptidyl-tRNA hydrolase
VLSRFSPEEANTLAEASRIAVESVSDWLDGAELATLMNRYNGLDARVTNRE